MGTLKLKLLFVCIVVGCLVAVPGTAFASPYFSLLTEEDWGEAEYENIQPMEPTEWSDYMDQFNNPNNLEGEPYPETTFVPAQLYVYGGGGEDPCTGYQYPNDAGLVMAWGDPCMLKGQYASAWEFEYGEDPDLSNSSVTIQVEPPCGITTISVGLKDINGRIRSWRWNVAAAGVPPPPLPVGTLQCSPDAAGLPVRHTITINLAQTGVTAANPQAASYSNYNSPPNPPPAFNIKNVQSFVYDEDANFVATSWVPPPGQTDPKPWNYWFNLTVTPNPPAVEGKFFVKWSQPPVRDPCDPNFIHGWDEWSDYFMGPILADDWKCEDKRPVTDVHWWGSFWGWDIPVPPPVIPHTFHIGIWTDIPAGADPNFAFSHPGLLLWENYCDNWVWEFIGYDKDPWQIASVNDSCFQFTQLLSQDEWFHQDPNAPGDTDGDPNTAVFWLSIAAIYDPNDTVKYPFGWKTRPHFWNDDAVFIWNTTWWPPTTGANFLGGAEIMGPNNVSWDLAFELTTKEPAYEDRPTPGDLNVDRIVDLLDFAIFASNWLVAVP